MPKTALRTDADFDVFYERHWKYVFRLCFTYMKNEADAENCTEDVFVKVLTQDITFEDETHERKWLTVTAINLCKDKLKSFARKKVSSINDDGMLDVAEPEKEDYSNVRNAIMSLPPKHKDVIWLYYYEGCSTDEIARIFGCPSSTIRNRLKDARKKLEKLLKGKI